ncbi:MAG: dUTP diphosphatase [Dehalococcoidia bacterium]|jgi:dUTP pyrophosphatase|nr:dUTP diphosphatase [Dehalococcoidia bacterium]
MGPVLKVKRLRPGARLPVKATEGASGLDLFACLEQGELMVGPRPLLVPTGIAIELPPGYEAQVRPRSGISLQGVMVALGTIDADYRGELLVTMYTLPGLPPYVVRHGDRIAQLVVSRLEPLPVVEVEDLSPTPRGTRGHGSTGR